MYGGARYPISEPMSTSVPALRSRIAGSTARATFTEPSRFVGTTRSKISPGTSSSRP